MPPLTGDLLNQYHAMQLMQHPIIWDRQSTGRKLKYLRKHNENIARYTCKFSRLYKMHNFNSPSIDVPCHHEQPYQCDNCDDFYKSQTGENDVSPRIMSSEKGLSSWSKDQISALESGRDVTIEKVLFYAYLAQIPLSEILVLGEGYYFDADGIIRQNIGN